ncbi:MAG TPA: hypothetical protein VM736_01035 [Gemmatimonadales bacterium]|nr:hypothetical protein [Gemmatimonadales bacterium]
MIRIALATYAKLPNLGEDDRVLLPALAELGVAAVPAVWDAQDVHWEDFQGVLVRSCWDYHEKRDEFLRWLARLERAGVAVWNPFELLRWNVHKGYLRDLEARGVEVVETRWLARGDAVELDALLHGAGWQEAVVKPAVSASAHRTWRTSAATAGVDQARLDAQLRAGDAMVQPFLREVPDRGEWSIVFLGGRLSHAVLKRPAPGEYRVQWEFGGSAESRIPARRLIRDAERVMAALATEPLYARVDGVERGSALVLMELELVEPHLFLGWDAGAAQQLAAALAGQLPPVSRAARSPARE